MNKREARTFYASLRDALPTEERNTAAIRLAEAFLIPAGVTFVGLYAARGSELSLDPLAEKLWKHGIRTAFPACEPKGSMKFFAVRDFKELTKGRFGIREPLYRMHEIVPELVIAPCLAADREGNRLGWGGGYYDRWLAYRGDKVRVLAAAFPCQLAERLPSDPWDRPVDGILLSSGELVRVKGEHHEKAY